MVKVSTKAIFRIPDKKDADKVDSRVGPFSKSLLKWLLTILVVPMGTSS